MARLQPRSPSSSHPFPASVLDSRRAAQIRFAALLLFAMALIRSAWVSDDAFITFRTIDNFWHGYGLRWNVIERVQSYTHPLWMFVLTAPFGIVRDPQWTTFIVSFLCTAGTLTLLVRRLPVWPAAAAVLMLTASRAFVDYSTSGLENPLSFLLLTAFWLLYLADDKREAASSSSSSSSSWLQERRLFWLALLASLTVLNRQDLLLLIAPALMYAAWCVWTQRGGLRAVLPALAVSAIPLVLWHGFSLIYYGFLLPNTAYAKLGHGLPRGALIAQGFHYLGDSLTSDPVTMTVILAALVITAIAAVTVAARTLTGLAAIAAGLLLHVGYIIWVGGDFMSGRFLTPAFLTSVVVLASIVPRLYAERWPQRWPLAVPIAVAALLLWSFAISSSPLRITSALPRVGNTIPGYHGIVDERAVYYPFTGLIPKLRGIQAANHVWAAAGAQSREALSVREFSAVGMYGYFAGPRAHVIDVYGLADPLMARLPATSDWRIGHFARMLPAGYAATVTACQQRVFPAGEVSPAAMRETCLSAWKEINRIEDPRIAVAYHELLRITQGPLFDADRLRQIIRWNIGAARVPSDVP